MTGTKRGREDVLLDAMSKIVELCTMEPQLTPPPDFINGSFVGDLLREEQRKTENDEAERETKRRKDLLASEIRSMISDMKNDREELFPQPRLR